MASMSAMKPAPTAIQAGRGVAIPVITAEETLNGIRLGPLITRPSANRRSVCGFYDCCTQVVTLRTAIV
jgi:hypothetical protein